MSPSTGKSSAGKSSTAKRVPYKAPRSRHELVFAIAVGVAIFVVTATLVWFLRPNRESASTPVTTTPASTVAPTDTTAAPTDTTAAPTDTTPTDTTPTDTTAPAAS